MLFRYMTAKRLLVRRVENDIQGEEKEKLEKKKKLLEKQKQTFPLVRFPPVVTEYPALHWTALCCHYPFLGSTSF